MDNESGDSVTQWLSGLRLNKPNAANELWRRFFSRLVRLARYRLGGCALRVVDEEDIAGKVLHEFMAEMSAGGFAEVRNRTDLWRLLTTITCRKVVSEIREVKAKKRGGGKVRGESVFIAPAQSQVEPQPGLDAIDFSGPSPDAIVAAVEEIDRMYSVLPTPEMRRVVAMRMEGFSNPEIAEATGDSLRTVERTLQQIRALWS